MTPSGGNRGSVALGIRLAALALAVAVVGAPIDSLLGYALLVIAAIIVFSGTVTLRSRRWMAALVVAVVAALVQAQIATPRIEEGHNVFLGEAQGRALQAGLPRDVYRFMAAQFDVRYPVADRCDPKAAGCWRGQAGPDRAFAFSADAIWERPEYSRRVATISFSDPLWLRLGFFNDYRYNWYTGTSDVVRVERMRGLSNVMQPWRVAMPFFVKYRLPEGLAGGHLCWRGDVLWEARDARFEPIRHEAMTCRAIAPEDAGRRVFGVSIVADAPLAMQLRPPAAVQWRQAAGAAIPAAAVAAVLLLLVTWRTRTIVLPFTLVGLAVAVVALVDASVIGGVRPLDGGDDGLFYEGVGRNIVQHALAGDWYRALEGGEAVFYYGGPGLRYFRAIERLLFGEGFLGYLSLLLVMPFVVLALFRRFLPLRVAIGLTLMFVAVPLGALFGTTFYQYAGWVARGFADPAAYIFFIAGVVLLVGKTSAGPAPWFWPAFGAGLLFALALFMRPVVALAVAVLLGGAGVTALWHRQWRRVAGLCLGFLPTFGMTLHNWVFGGVFVLFSANVGHPDVFVTPAAVYLDALREIAGLNVAGDNVLRVLRQLVDWLRGPSGAAFMVPLHAAAAVVLVRVVFWPSADAWLRLIAGAALAQHLIGMTHVPITRYYYLAWLLTFLVAAVWVCREAWPWLCRRHPGLRDRIGRHPARAALRSILTVATRGSRPVRPASARRGEAAG